VTWPKRPHPSIYIRPRLPVRLAVAAGSFGGFSPHLLFFLFLVVRNSASFAPPCPRKMFADWWLECGSGAKLSEFRPGGGAKLPRVGAKLVIVSRQQVGWAPPTEGYGIQIMVGGAHPTSNS
jgi:hypothetical protein